jgi:cell wall-associated NlpC family hydrolase
VRRLAIGGMALFLCFSLGLGACGAVLASSAAGTAPAGAPTAAASPTAAGARTATGVLVSGRPGPGDPPGVRTDVPAVPTAWEALEQEAAATCKGLGWSVLAAIGRVETNSGRSTLPGVQSGANAAGAEGPMQFEPSTFAAYAVVGPGGATPPSPYDTVDAVYTAAHLLCSAGAGRPSGLYQAVWDYDHSGVYVETVLVLATALGADPMLGTLPATAIAFAAAQLGVPYLWGGTGPGGYDCSGLVQAAYRWAGVALPRDLVFFGSSVRDVSHVGIYVGGGEMVDAPHTGAVVRVEPTPILLGMPWGGDVVVGITQPVG